MAKKKHRMYIAQKQNGNFFGWSLVLLLCHSETIEINIDLPDSNTENKIPSVPGSSVVQPYKHIYVNCIIIYRIHIDIVRL